MTDYKALRIQEGLSLSDIARRTGFSRGHISNVENNASRPSQTYHEAFLRAVNLSDSTPLETQRPITKVLSELATLHKQAEQANQQLSLAIAEARNSAKANQRMLDLVFVLVQDQMKKPKDIDLSVAPPDVQAQASQHIVGVIVDVLMHWNVHNLEESTKIEVVNNITRLVLERLA